MLVIWTRLEKLDVFVFPSASSVCQDCYKSRASRMRSDDVQWNGSRTHHPHSYTSEPSRAEPNVACIRLVMVKCKGCIHTPSVAFRLLPPKKDVVNQCLEYAFTLGVSWTDVSRARFGSAPEPVYCASSDVFYESRNPWSRESLLP